MPTTLYSYRTFFIRLLRNYIFGSVVAVLGVGGVMEITTIRLDARDSLIMVGTLFVSLLIMLVFESMVFRKHIQPFITLMAEQEHPSLPTLRAAHLQAHRLPVLSLRRILGPHLLGLSVPAALLTWLEISQGILHIPYAYISLAAVGAPLVAGTHGLIEYFLTSEAVQPMILHVESLATERYREQLSLHGRVLVSIRTKFVMSALLFGCFPLLLFGLASEVRLATSAQTTLADVVNYLSWAGLILIIGAGFALFGAWLLWRSVSRPISALQLAMKTVQDGNLKGRVSDLYADEFSRLVAGFNHMVQGLRDRDQLNTQLLDSYFTTLAAALDARDPYTAGHSVRVAQYAVQIGNLSSLDAETMVNLRKSALLHDIGKIGIRDDVLLKEGRLTDEEFYQIQQHPAMGEAILLQIQPQEAMAPLLPGVRSHHERYDGRGYPDRLAGELIPVFGRIIAVADAYDAMTSDRPYRKGMPKETALRIIEEGQGTQWDPGYAASFVAWMRSADESLHTESMIAAGSSK